LYLARAVRDPGHSNGRGLCNNKVGHPCPKANQ